MATFYEPPVYRPPSEAESLILQVTIGCSYNACAFCGMYRAKRFRVKRQEEIRADVAEARDLLGPDVSRVFLADGDALCLSARRLMEILGLLGDAFPRLRRVASYANARDVLRKSDEELRQLARRKLTLVYLGLESGDDPTLEQLGKRSTSSDMIRAAQRARAAGIATSAMVMIGVAGRDRSLVHARRTAEVLDAMEPTYTALLTFTPVPGTPLAGRVERGDLELPSPMDSLREIRELVSRLTCRTHLGCEHPSNWLPLRGRMPSAREELLGRLDAALAGTLPLRPAGLRTL